MGSIDIPEYTDEYRTISGRDYTQGTARYFDLHTRVQTTPRYTRGNTVVVCGTGSVTCVLHLRVAIYQNVHLIGV